jgi:hypothetical protein
LSASRNARPVAVAIALIALAARGSPVFPATLDAAHVPVVAIGFEGQSDTFPYPGGIAPVLGRATARPALTRGVVFELVILSSVPFLQIRRGAPESRSCRKWASETI